MIKRLLLGLVLYCGGMVGQGLAIAPPGTTDARVIVQVPALNPGAFAAVGGGFQHGVRSSWATYCKKTTESIYACVAVDLIGNTKSTRAGIETIVLHRGPLYVTVKADAGGSTGSSGTGAAYGAGMSVVYQIDKITKVPGIYAVFSVSALKQDISTLGKEMVIRIGIGKTF